MLQANKFLLRSNYSTENKGKPMILSTYYDLKLLLRVSIEKLLEQKIIVLCEKMGIFIELVGLLVRWYLRQLKNSGCCELIGLPL